MIQFRPERKITSNDLPPLEAGDHLTREEFERRYAVTPGVKKAELIEGVVYMQFSVRFQHHGRPNALLAAWLVYYEAQTQGVLTAENSSARLDVDNMPQPDALLMIDPACGGQAKLSEDDYIEDAPELVAEVSGSTASIDMHTKFKVYERCGVKEYLVWRTRDQEIDWFVLKNGKFVRQQADAGGIFRSAVFPGLWLNSEAILVGDMASVFKTLDAGMATTEHAVFVETLREQGTE